ncbi:hypothetical protein GCM10011491_41620 [Brucella endophytica]|uniref:Uncharacterized protein n=1 Tax=Brucella endophytica TaxID=1963359 RepID=A0A916SP85_9HYPH|nr:hypothetical protein [Brucella endophytica]GGB09321.1 hypothetical protein GCM10011491_41620 [Brucella endophytica]
MTKRRAPPKRKKMNKSVEKSGSKEKLPEKETIREQRRRISAEFQRRFREEQAELGRKAVTLWLDPDIHAFIEQIRDQEGFQNLRETTYHLLKKGLVQKDEDDT